MDEKYIVEKIQAAGYACRIAEIERGGRKKKAVMVGTGPVKPTITLEELDNLRMLSKNEESFLRVLMEELGKALENAKEIEGNATRDAIIKNLRIGICQEDKISGEMLTKPSGIDGITIYVYSIFGEGIGRIRKESLKPLEITEEEIWKKAMENTRKNTIVEKLNAQYFREHGAFNHEIDIVEMIEYMCNRKIFVVTNREKNNGAAGILIPDVFHELKKYGEIAVVIPSSIHECIVIIDDEFSSEELEQLEEDINEVNQQLREVEILAWKPWVVRMEEVK